MCNHEDTIDGMAEYHEDRIDVFVNVPCPTCGKTMVLSGGGQGSMFEFECVFCTDEQYTAWFYDTEA